MVCLGCTVSGCTKTFFFCFVQVQLINDAYNIVIDAMLGLETDSSNIKEPYSGILVTLKQIKIPIVSVDVPSGEFLFYLTLGQQSRINRLYSTYPGALASRKELSRCGVSHGG